MNLLNYTNKLLRTSWHSIIGFFFLAIFSLPIQAQEPLYAVPSWWFGASTGANFSLHHGTNRQLNTGFSTPVAFGKGDGIGLYLGPLLEYHRPYSKWGFMLQAGYDNRQGAFEAIVTSCNCPADLSTNLAYISIEPSLRISPFLNRLNFYVYAGPRLALNLEKSFNYQQGINPATPEQEPDPAVKGNFDRVEKVLVSMQVGAGYDIPISSQLTRPQLVVSPFIAYHPSFGQSPRSTESWGLSTLRVGAALKLGQGRKLDTFPTALYPDPNVRFYVSAPANIPVERVVREVFPLRNYVFFDLGSTEIPERYVLLRKDQANDFEESQLALSQPDYRSSRSQRQMVVYYNVLNILGDRMGKSPYATIRLVGSSSEGFDDGMAMAVAIQQYLVNLFGIDASRITTVGRDKPKIPSEQPGGTLELDLLRQGDRRVSIESNSLDLLTEFQHGPDAQLRPVEIIATQTAPPDSYVSFVNVGASTAFLSWSMEITDDQGKVQNFGPYTQDRVAIAGKSILGTRPEGYYDIIMKGISDNGYIVQKEATVRMVLWTPPKEQEGMRFSVLYEFNESKSISIYEKYLTDMVVPKIPNGGTVIIQGHTDIIGDEDYNQKLSLERADDVLGILRKSLEKSGKTGVNFEIYGFGEDPSFSPFDNNFPEERFYNRTVVIDIIPPK